ncbi:hypothetical protein ACHAXA_003769 [Cyclostephanos tholiformis]|uniref:Uncharacterized protein n=1 Tax=Cyclostephanos tholiformis TaxID=382380 RepID=A0ABD3ST18_9STRA
MRRPPWRILITLRLVASLASPLTDDRSSRPNVVNDDGGGVGRGRPRMRLRLNQVHVIHRHGDRTPITPMKDESYWRGTLPESSVLDGISRGTYLLRRAHPPGGGDDGETSNGSARHGAQGRGPFGQLTMMGLLQMVELGERLRSELTVGHDDDADEKEEEDDEMTTMGRLRLFTPEVPLHPRRVKVMSTDFPRTIQSVQALLVGLFPDLLATPSSDHREDDDDDEILGRTSASIIEIDVSHTNGYFIPDPQPRQHDAQLDLERHLSLRSHLMEREWKLRDYACRITDALGEHMGEGAWDVSFGIGQEEEEEEGGGSGDKGEENDDDDDDVVVVAGGGNAGSSGIVDGVVRRRPLAWAQMCEVLVCLSSRGMLPDSLSEEDVAIVSDHVAWRWFENLGHPVLAKSAMFKFANCLVESMRRKANEVDVIVGVGDRSRGEDDDGAERQKKHEDEEEPMLRIYSAHDSTLIGLLCVLGLERPVEWPEYGSALKVELIGEEEEEADGHDTNDAVLRPRRHWVRFSLNGQVLRCTWHRNDFDEPASMVPLDKLEEMIHMEHELFDDDCDNPNGLRLKYSWKGGMLSRH